MMTAIVDQEANDFALELLMPADWLLRDAHGLDLTDDEGVAKLARKYKVPTAAMAYRLGELRAEQAASIKSKEIPNG